MKKNENKHEENYWIKNFLNEYIKIFNQEKNKWIDDDVLNEYNDISNKLNKSIKNYKKEFKKYKLYLSKFFLFLSIILLFIPFYWARKWHKKLSSQQNDYLSNIESIKNQKKEIHKKIISKFNFNDFFNSFEQVLKYKHMGPIPQRLIDEIIENSFIDFSESEFINSYKSSWGIFENNKIVLHWHKQNLIEYMETYYGSEKIYYKDGSGRLVSETIYASYTHPAISIDSKNKNYSFMESCANLEFSFISNSNKKRSNKFNNKKNYASLENEEFDQKFNWERNDETQFRMIFTPWTQETFLNETKNDDVLFDEFKWKKQHSFFSNEFNSDSINSIWYKTIQKFIFDFLNNAEIAYETFLNNIFNCVIQYYQNIFKSLNYMYLTTIMPSEDHKNIINNVVRQNYDLSYKNISLLCQYILNELFYSNPIINLDTKCYNRIEDIESIIDFNNHKICKIKILGIGYKITELVKYVRVFAFKQSVDVPVYYKDYQKQTDYAYLYAAYLNTKFYYYSNIENTNSILKTNIQNQTLLQWINLLEEYDAKITINSNSFGVLLKDNLNVDDLIKKIFKELNIKD